MDKTPRGHIHAPPPLTWRAILWGREAAPFTCESNPPCLGVNVIVCRPPFTFESVPPCLDVNVMVCQPEGPGPYTRALSHARTHISARIRTNTPNPSPRRLGEQREGKTARRPAVDRPIETLAPSLHCGSPGVRSEPCTGVPHQTHTRHTPGTRDTRDTRDTKKGSLGACEVLPCAHFNLLDREDWDDI